MKEVKFKAFIKRGINHLAQGTVVDVLFMNFTNKNIMYSFLDREYAATKDEYELREYTGLKDKNGVEIFEGDIVEFCDFDSLRTGGNTSDKIIRGYVSMSYGTWSIEVNGGDTVYELWNAHENDSELEVLGNRFENPELLEV